ncbi:hypothetical protein RHMOL_Rhmol10G0091600 [Rhododendron molle]|uniref:Uncharacterized protein n=1 Tax=Rhododendron molle TaxID=49168 RepID=A0ACC0M1N3_RHOML|nr:hypothetical protein RHMOL_Rhmol10G0091600 [Rhododendron molle]
MLISVLQEENRPGESTQKGFYLYDDNGKASPDPNIQKYVEKAQITSDVTLMKLSDGDINEMIFFPIVNEACRILAEGVAAKASNLDIASVLGMEFPAYRGGIIVWANFIGSTYICSKLKGWSMTHGDFFMLCAYLAERAAKGASLAHLVVFLSNDKDGHGYNSESDDSFEQEDIEIPPGGLPAQSHIEPQCGATPHPNMESQASLPPIAQPQNEVLPKNNGSE